MNNNEYHKTDTAISYSPGALLTVFSNSLISPILNTVLIVKGIFKKGKGVNYNGFYYDILKDEYSDSSLTLVVPALLRASLSESQTIEISAYLSKRLSPSSGRIDVLLTVTEVVSRKETLVNENQKRSFEILEQKAKSGYKDVDNFIKAKLYQQETVRVSIIVGISAIIDSDINHQLREAVRSFSIKYVRINLTRPSEILQAMNDNDNEDILVISRGGGESIQIFDNPVLAEAAIKLPCKFITAIGHSTDIPLLERVADKSFITPTALGQYFYDIHNSVIEQVNNSKSKLIEDITKQMELNFKNTIDNLNAKVAESAILNKEVTKDYQNRIDFINKRFIRSQTFNWILIAALLIAIIILAINFV